jgi:proline iminopeptidase
MEPIPPPRESGFTTTTAHPLYWARWGLTGSPQLLVLHGGPGAHHDYLLPQMLVLSDEYETVFYDQRGGGQSKTATVEPITWRTQVDDLAAVVAELIDGPLTLVGYSWGGLLAMLYAVCAKRDNIGPTPVRLVLIDPASPSNEFRRQFEAEFARRQESEWVRNHRAALSASGLRERDPAAYRQRSFELSVAGYFADPANASGLTPFRVTSRVQQSVWESLGDFDIQEGIRELETPSLVVHGRQDPIPLQSSEGVADALGASLVVLDDCGHVPYVEQPAQFFSAVRAFLRATSSKGSE